MEDFLIKNYSLLTNVAVLLAAFVGLVTLKKFRGTKVKYFIYFLVFVFLLEVIANYPKYFLRFEKFHLIEGTIFEKNYWWYNLSWCIGSTMFYTYYFQGIIKNSIYKAILKYGRFIFLIGSLIYLVFRFNEFFSTIANIIYLPGIFLILISLILYLLELLKSENILKFYQSINFYIAVILLIWCLVTTPLIFYDIYVASVDWSFILLIWKIRLIANFFMYLGFAFALIWCKPEKSILKDNNN